MRATLSSTYRTLQAHLNRMGNDLSELNITAATGKKFRKPSDDPSAIRPLLHSRSEVRVNDRYLSTMSIALDKLNATDSLFDHMENIMVGIKEEAVAGMSGSLTAQDRISIADKVGHMRDELLSMANSQVDGKYIFAGFEEQTKPFTVNATYNAVLYDPTDSTTWPIQYNGDVNTFSLGIGPGETVRTNVAGANIFLGDADNDGSVDSGRVDIFAVLTRLEEALRLNSPGGINQEMDNIDTSANQIRIERGKLGNNGNRVVNAISDYEDTQIDLNTIISRFEDADIIKTITDITQAQTAFEAALSITTQISRLSILNYL